MNKIRITMKEIAKEAGVSVTTVSHVINGSKKITEETIYFKNMTVKCISVMNQATKFTK